MASRDGGDGFDFCDTHLVQNCRLCQNNFGRNANTIEEIRAMLRDTIVSFRETSGVALGAAANYEDLPELPVESPAVSREPVVTAAQAMAHNHNTRPRLLATVRRSHTSPDALMNRRTVHPSTPASPITPTAAAEGSGDAAGGKPVSRRKGIDSFLRATKKKLTTRSRRAADRAVSASADVPQQAALSPVELPLSPAGQHPVVNNSPARVPIIIPVTNGGLPEALPSRSRDMTGRQMKVHTTVDYRHYLVPGLTKVTNCGFYWGVMDRYKAESLLDNKPEGTFLLRDSSQDDFIFSVSFRRYGRSLHARVEQWNHMFSFDAHDSGVFKADSVTTLLEHYKDPQTCMFFEPMLTRPLNRPQPFSLMHLARAVVCDHISYDSIDSMLLPKDLQQYLKYYHYKQQIRVRTDTSWIVLHPNPNF